MPKLRKYTTGRVDSQATKLWVILMSQVQMSKIYEDVPAIVTKQELCNSMGFTDKRSIYRIELLAAIISAYCAEGDLPNLSSVIEGSARDNIPAVLKQDWWMVRVPSISAFREIWDNLGKEDEEDLL